jgi:hypothetical protein
MVTTTTDGACDDDIVSVALNSKGEQQHYNKSTPFDTRIEFCEKLVNFVFINLPLVPLKIFLKFILNLFLVPFDDL